MQGGKQGFTSSIGDQHFGVRVQSLVVLSMLEHGGEELRELLSEQGMAQEECILIEALLCSTTEVFNEELRCVKSGSAI